MTKLILCLVLLALVAAAPPAKKPTAEQQALQKISADKKNFNNFKVEKVFLFSKEGNKIMSVHLTDAVPQAKPSGKKKAPAAKAKKPNQLVVWIGLTNHAVADAKSKFTQVAASEDTKKHALTKASPLAAGALRTFVETTLYNVGKAFAISHPASGGRAAYDLFAQPMFRLCNQLWAVGMSYEGKVTPIVALTQYKYNAPGAVDDLFAIVKNPTHDYEHFVTNVKLTKDQSGKKLQMECRVTGEVEGLPREVQVNFQVKDTTPSANINRRLTPVSGTVARLIHSAPPVPGFDKKATNVAKKNQEAKKKLKAIQKSKEDEEDPLTNDEGVEGKDFILVPGPVEKIAPKVFLQISDRLFDLCARYVARGSATGQQQWESNWLMNDVISSYGKVSWTKLAKKYRYPVGDDFNAMYGDKTNSFRGILIRGVVLKNHKVADAYHQIKAGPELVCHIQGPGALGRMKDLFVSFPLNEDKEAVGAVVRHLADDEQGDEIDLDNSDMRNAVKILSSACLSFADEYDEKDIFDTTFQGEVVGRPVLVRRALEEDFVF